MWVGLFLLTYAADLRKMIPGILSWLSLYIHAQKIPTDIYSPHKYTLHISVSLITSKDKVCKITGNLLVLIMVILGNLLFLLCHLQSHHDNDLP